MIPREILKKVRQIEIRTNRIGMFACLLIALSLCACAVKPPVWVQLPAETTINQGAGRGDFLFITVRSQDGNDLLFCVDTGVPITILDKSLESRLGKCYGIYQKKSEWFGNLEHKAFKAPKLYLGNARLTTGKWVFAVDLSQKFITDYPLAQATGRRVDGILGIDCLQHYCIQLDFAAGKMRFLNPDCSTNNLGTAFPLGFQNWRMRASESLGGEQAARSWIDTGDPNDGMLLAGPFDRIRLSQKKVPTKEFNTPGGGTGMAAAIPSGTFGGLAYTNLVLVKTSDENCLGLRFLARHLVTFNFPKQTMYLKQTSIGPLADAVENHHSTP